MDREVWLRSGMVLSVLALAALILVTPQLMGEPAPELASLPLLVIGMTRDETEFIVNVDAAVQAYRYDLIQIDVNGTDPAINQTHFETETYGFNFRIPSDATFNLRAYVVDRQSNYYEYNVTGWAERDEDNRLVMVFTFPYEDEASSPPVRVTPPADFRIPIPLRGNLEEAQA